MEERAEQIPRMGDVLRIELSNGVYRRREPYTRHQINELSSLLPTQKTTGGENQFHQKTATVKTMDQRKALYCVNECTIPRFWPSPIHSQAIK